MSFASVTLKIVSDKDMVKYILVIEMLQDSFVCVTIDTTATTPTFRWVELFSLPSAIELIYVY